MFNFYKSENEKFEDIFRLNNRITKSLIEENILKMSDFEDYVLPYSMEQIIPRIENIANNAKLLTNAISKILNLESFLTVDKKKINKKTFYGEDFIVLDETYFTTNPLSNYVEKLKENMKKYNKDEVMFHKIGYISRYELKKIHNNLKNNIVECMEPLNISNIKIEYILDNLITEAIEKNASFVRMYLKKGSIKAIFNIGYQTIEKELISCSLNEYINISKYIISIFSKKTLFKEYKTERFKLKLKLNKSTEDTTTIDVIGVKISNLDEDIFNIDNISLSSFDKKEFDRKCELPSGLLIVSSNNNLKESLYSIIKNQLIIKPSKKIYTIENYIEKTIESVIQFEMNENINWKDLNLTDYPITAIDSINNKEEFNILIDAVSRGKFIILGVNANNSIEAFSKLHYYTDNYKLLADNLLGIIHMDSIPKVCPYCSNEMEFIKNSKYHDFSIFDNAPKMNEIIKIEKITGCDNCLNGYEGMASVSEYLNNDEILKESILDKFNLKSLRIEKNSNSWENIFEASAKLLSDGITSPNGIVTSIGRPRKN